MSIERKLHEFGSTFMVTPFFFFLNEEFIERCVSNWSFNRRILEQNKYSRIKPTALLTVAFKLTLFPKMLLQR